MVKHGSYRNQRIRANVNRQLRRRGLTPSSSSSLRELRREVRDYDRASNLEKALYRYNSRLSTGSPAKIKLDRDIASLGVKIWGPSFKNTVNALTKRLNKEAKKKPPTAKKYQEEVSRKILPKMIKANYPHLKTTSLVSRQFSKEVFNQTGHAKEYINEHNRLKIILATLGQFKVLRWADDKEDRWAFMEEIFKNEIDRLVGNPYEQLALEGEENLFISTDENGRKAYTVDNAMRAMELNLDFTFTNARNVRAYDLSTNLPTGERINLGARLKKALDRDEFRKFKERRRRERKMIEERGLL